MFIFIPLVLILASVGGILFIVWRKLPRLEKLAETESSSGAIKKDWVNIIYDFCPEIWDWIRGIKIEEYKEMWLVETEKLLRRFRLISLKMDRLFDSLIKKIRKQTFSQNGLTYTARNETKSNNTRPDAEVEEKNKEELKKIEQKLILEIAKNPKNLILYESLGDLYVKTESYQDAKEAYEATIELNPQNAELKEKLSQTLERLNKPEGSQN